MDIILPPDWFLNVDILISGISFFIILLFSLLCRKNYLVNKDKKFLNLGAGFGLVALAQLIITAAKTVVYYNLISIQVEGTIPSNIITIISVASSVGLFLYRAATLFGLYVVYKTPRKVIERDSLLIMYLVIIITVLSEGAVHLFHITALVILALMIAKYYEVYKKNRSGGTFILMLAFAELAISNIIFIFANQTSMVYVTASLIELASYITLLALIIMILEHGKKYSKKKKQNGYNL